MCDEARIGVTKQLVRVAKLVAYEEDSTRRSEKPVDITPVQQRCAGSCEKVLLAVSAATGDRVAPMVGLVPARHRFLCIADEPVVQHGGGGLPREPRTIAFEHERQTSDFSCSPRDETQPMVLVSRKDLSELGARRLSRDTAEVTGAIPAPEVAIAPLKARWHPCPRHFQARRHSRK